MHICRTRHKSNSFYYSYPGLVSPLHDSRTLYRRASALSLPGDLLTPMIGFCRFTVPSCRDSWHLVGPQRRCFDCFVVDCDIIFSSCAVEIFIHLGHPLPLRRLRQQSAENEVSRTYEVRANAIRVHFPFAQSLGFVPETKRFHVNL